MEVLGVQVERKIRLGEVIMAMVTVFGLVGGWFALQSQVSANTETINKNLQLIQEIRDDVDIVKEWQVRSDAFNAGRAQGRIDHEEAGH